MSDELRSAAYLRFGSEPAKTPQAAIYCRVASADDFAVKMQEKILRSYATEQMIDVREVFSDNGASGVTFDRPAFQRMMRCIKSGGINCVIVKDLARLSRNYIRLNEWIGKMSKKHIRVISVNDGYDSSAINDDFTHQLAEAVEKLRKAEHSMRIRAGIAHSRQRRQEQAATTSE
jgi:DNA invertase Pin-like site-specific DNA recombinase